MPKADIRGVIGPYAEKLAECLEYDPRVADAASALAGLIGEGGGLLAEHIGSTSVVECPGKGVIDLMVLYKADGLEAARQRLDQMGFQRQSGRDPFPESRPMRIGSWAFGGKVWAVHAHVLEAGCAEAEELRRFRDMLRNDADLRARYAARKREIVATGPVDSLEYCYAKSAFVESALVKRT